MHKTPWTKGAANTPASSLPSERLRPKNNNNNIQPKQGQQKSKSQQQQQQPGSVQKSKAVRDLESLISNLESHNITPIRDPKGGCFCLAREHPLSPYTPLCTSCGLILCNLNKPYHTCPHCNTDGGILTPQQRTSLLTQLRETLDSTLAQEEADCVRQIEEAKKAAGAFPTLSSSGGGGGTTKLFMVTPTPTLPQQHKVLSLTPANKSKSGGGNRKTVVTVSSYTSTPVSSRPATPSSVNSATGGEVENRVLPPPQTVHYVVANHHHHQHQQQQQPRSNSRPWQNFGDGGGISVRYCAPVSPPPEEVVEGGEGGSTDPEKTKSRRKRKGKGVGGGGPRGSV